MHPLECSRPTILPLSPCNFTGKVLQLTCQFCTDVTALTKIDGLSSLETLEELWLSRNRIADIGNGLPLGLRDINLAHNRLGCFKELLKLAPLEVLRSLTLQDPHFGDNPVCGLSNYKTYVAYHLTQVRHKEWPRGKRRTLEWLNDRVA